MTDRRKPCHWGLLSTRCHPRGLQHVFQLGLRVVKCDGECLLAGGRSVVHRVIENLLTDRTEATGPELVLDGGVNYELPDSILNLESHSVNLEQFRILLEDGVLRLGKDPQQGIPVKGVEVGDDRETTDDLGNETIGAKILGINVFQEVVLVNGLLLGRAESDDLGVEPLGYAAFDSDRKSVV